jgi:replication-associated recombination protein RarA
MAPKHPVSTRKPVQNAPALAPRILEDQSVVANPATTEQPKAPKVKAPKRDRSTLYANLKGIQPTDVITLVPGAKAKQKGTMAEAKFALYGEGNIPVSEVQAKCQGDNRAKFNGKALKPSIAWDWAHGLILINGKAYEPTAKAS